MTKQKPISELKGFALFQRSQVTRELEWSSKGYWIHKALESENFNREHGKFCPDCVLLLSEVKKTREITAYLKCDECDYEIGKRARTAEEMAQ